MRYTKPEVVVSVKAIDAVKGQSTPKANFHQLDADMEHYNVSITAYEADE